MKPRCTNPVLPALFAVLGGCGGGHESAAPALPDLPPLQLRPFLPALKELAASLPQPDEAEQREVKELGEVALHLVEADPRTASRAERALLEHAFAWWVLEPALQHEQVTVRRRAAWLCGQSGRSVLQLPLLLRLKYELDPETVLWVADALQRLGNDTGLAWLDAAMNQQGTAQQAGTMAIDVCRERGLALADPPTYAELQGRLRELSAAWRERGEGSRVVAPAKGQLEARFAAHLITTENYPLRPIDDARYVLTRCGRLAVPLLIRTLAASEPYLRTMALQVLAELGPAAHDAAESTLPLLGDPLTASYAMRTLGEIGAADAIPHLRARLPLPDVELRAAAVQALGLLQDRASAARLTERMQDATEALDVRVGAAFGLLCLGENPAADAFLTDRETKGDYHAPTLSRLRERLHALRR
ncbi:MAG TPA: HEAT repeat domain-containing protein [Planctomycetota bacterium]|nr:HEAT repeat domain-containing protein [Planctomycetota bacterium]